MHPDGYVEVKDRSKDIIISGGENISSLEVEDALYRHPEIMEAAVVSRPDPVWGESPCAFVTLKPDAGPVSAEDIWLGAAPTWRTTRCHGPSCLARCPRPRPARSRNTNCATAPRR